MIFRITSVLICLLLATKSTSATTNHGDDLACKEQMTARENQLKKDYVDFKEQSELFKELMKSSHEALIREVELASSFKEQVMRDIYQLKHLMLNESNSEELRALREKCRRSANLNTVMLLNNKTYYFEQNQTKEWRDAKKFCEDHGMHLATTKSVTEIKILHKHLRAMNIIEYSWLSASDVDQEDGHYVWHDGTTLDTSSGLWDKENKHPKSFRDTQDDSCVEIYKGNHPKLYTVKCNRDAFFICERPTICELIM